MQASSTSDTTYRSRRSPTVRRIWGGSRPAFSNITKHIYYASGSGDYYSLLMGREFKPGRWWVLLYCDNKADEASHSGLNLVKKLNMDHIRRSQTEDSLWWVPLHILRRRATEGPHHRVHDNNVSGRRIQHARQVEERSVQLRP